MAEGIDKGKERCRLVTVNEEICYPLLLGYHPRGSGNRFKAQFRIGKPSDVGS